MAGAGVAQWVRSLDLATHTSLSPILRGFTPSFVNYKKWCTQLAATSDKDYTSCLPKVVVLSGYSGFPTTKNIAESSVKHQNSNSNPTWLLLLYIDHRKHNYRTYKATLYSLMSWNCNYSFILMKIYVTRFYSNMCFVKNTLNLTIFSCESSRYMTNIYPIQLMRGKKNISVICTV